MEDYSFSISGEVENASSDVVTLYKLIGDGEELVIDKAPAKNGNFTLQGDIILPSEAYILYGQEYIIPFFLDSDEMKILANTEISFEGHGTKVLRPHIIGSESNMVYQDYLMRLETLQKESEFLALDTVIDNYILAVNANDTMGVEKLKHAMENKYLLTEKKVDSLRAKIVLEYPESIVSPYIMMHEGMGLNDQSFSLSEMIHIFESFEPYLVGTHYYEEGKNLIKRIEKTTIGQIAPAFTLPMPDGSSLSLSDYKGSYVFLDFWAYWCGPCTDDFPALKQVYEDYHKMGFEIIGISDDPDVRPWKEAIAEHSLPWPQGIVFVDKTFSETVSELYNVTYLPTTYLIDREGTIIEKKLNANHLRKILSERITDNKEIDKAE